MHGRCNMFSPSCELTWITGSSEGIHKFRKAGSRDSEGVPIPTDKIFLRVVHGLVYWHENKNKLGLLPKERNVHNKQRLRRLISANSDIFPETRHRDTASV